MCMDVIMKKQKHCFVGISQAAHLLEYDRFYVNVLLWRGNLKGTKIGGKWRIPLHIIHQYTERRRTRKGGGL